MSKNSNPFVRLFLAVVRFDWYMFAVYIAACAVVLLCGVIIGFTLANDLPALTGGNYFVTGA